MTKTQSEWTGSVKQLMPFWSRQRRSRGPFQQNTRGEMIPKAGNHSFNYIFFLPSPSLSLPLLGCSLWPDVCHFATLLTASPFLHCVWSNGNCFLIQLGFSFHESLHLSPKPLSFTSVCLWVQLRPSRRVCVYMCACFLMGVFAVLIHITFKSQPASQLRPLT